uniref:Uncharacterized protein n=1 Tax=Rhizophora mucronata TaxID=61149 RepID=A0A2P2QAY6_RHIMU
MSALYITEIPKNRFLTHTRTHKHTKLTS